jgi:hypothetical protein
MEGQMNHADRLRFRIAARVIAQSCESCEQREFDYLLHDTFVCESCAVAA